MVFPITAKLNHRARTTFKNSDDTGPDSEHPNMQHPDQGVDSGV